MRVFADVVLTLLHWSEDETLVKSTTKKVLAVAVLAVVVLAVVGWQIIQQIQPREYQLDSARIAMLDKSARHAKIEFTHPKSGQKMTVAGDVPPDCPIYINEKPAKLDDLRVGDLVAVKARIGIDRNAVPLWVRVTRHDTTTQPSPEPSKTPPS